MWMQETDNITFTDISGNSFLVKDMKTIEEYDNTFTVEVHEDSLLDDICVRRETYGDNSEDQSYLIFEANKILLAENNFSLDRIKTLRVPVG